MQTRSVKSLPARSPRSAARGAAGRIVRSSRIRRMTSSMSSSSKVTTTPIARAARRRARQRLAVLEPRHHHRHRRPRIDRRAQHRDIGPEQLELAIARDVRKLLEVGIELVDAVALVLVGLKTFSASRSSSATASTTCRLRLGRRPAETRRPRRRPRDRCRRNRPSNSDPHAAGRHRRRRQRHLTGPGLRQLASGGFLIQGRDMQP
jgi:hypothetical protein